RNSAARMQRMNCRERREVNDEALPGSRRSLLTGSKTLEVCKGVGVMGGCNGWLGGVSTFIAGGSGVDGTAVTVFWRSEGSLEKTMLGRRMLGFEDARWHACSNAVANACTLANRRSGSFESATRTTSSTSG